MPKFDNYYVVEFRLPIKIDTANSVQEAVSIASQVCENQYGVKLENWYARIFEYTSGESILGYIKEYFYNPNSSTFREIKKNIEYFTDLAQKGLSPDKKKNSKIITKTLLEEN